MSIHEHTYRYIPAAEHQNALYPRRRFPKGAFLQQFYGPPHIDTWYTLSSTPRQPASLPISLKQLTGDVTITVCKGIDSYLRRGH